MPPRRTFLIVLALLLGLSLPGRTLAQKPQPPQPKIELLQPSGEDVLAGSVEVRIRVSGGGQMPERFYVGLGGPPWVPMERVKDSSDWAATIDTTLVPNGPQQLTVVSDNNKAGVSKGVTLGNPLRVFFGDLHSHTSYSDGTLVPTVAHQYARNEAKLDVFSLTDHLEKVDDAEWLDMREQAWDANVDGEFVAFPGLEWTKEWGHINIYDPKTRVWPSEPAKFYEALAAAGLTAKFNHPGDGTKSHGGLAYSEIGDQAIQMMEVRRPKEDQAFIRALDLGWHLAPDGSSDTHSPDWGNVRSWTGILAPGLSSRCILDALKNRRCYSTLDRNCQLRFEAAGAVMGEIVEEPVQNVAVAVVVADPDEGDALAKIELFQDGKVAATDSPATASRSWNTEVKPEPGKHYFFVKVTQADGNLLWSAPVWVRVE